jgi:hypothetical protein
MTKFMASPQGTLTEQERNVVYMTGLPLDRALKAAELDGSLPAFQDNVLTALPIMYAYNMFRHYVTEYSSMLVRTKLFLTESMGGTDANQCPREPAELLTMEINKAEKEIQKQHKLLMEEYRSQLELNGVDPLLLRQQVQELIEKSISQKIRLMQANER